MKNIVRNLIRSVGFDVVRYSPPVASTISTDPADEANRKILDAVAPFTMTSRERQLALIDAVRHLNRRGVQGCFVECGVWRGGSSMTMALTLLEERVSDRELYLFDTFEGMTPPTAFDSTTDGTLASEHLARDPNKSGGNWCVADLNDVQTNMTSTRYPSERVHFIQGPVEKTIPAQAPQGPIALLRLDTDWYESTRHEWEHLFQLVPPGGVIIIDDYGHWQGARRATDEFLATLDKHYLLQRIDYTGRLLIKV
jgi:O-methyltransferase